MEESEEPRIFRPHELRYYADSEEVPSESGAGSLIKIYDREQGGAQVHQFERDLLSIGPFFPFLKEGTWFALCSPIHDRTTCIRLPDGEIVAECDSAMTIPVFDLDDNELEPSTESICPVSCYVPHLHKLTHDWGENYASRGKSQRHWNTYHEVESDGHEIRRKLPEYFFAADIGFVAGCIWGADMQLEILCPRSLSIAHRRSSFHRNRAPHAVENPRCVPCDQRGR